MEKLRGKIVEYLWIIFLFLLFVVSMQMVKDGFLIEKIASLGIWAPTIFILLKASTLVIAPLGGTPLYLIAGSLFGNLNGFIFVFTGDIIGSTICFCLSRFYGEKIVKTLAGENFFKKITDTVKILENIRSFIKARVALFLMPEILAYAGGLSKMKFSTFILINSSFYALTTFIMVFFGSKVFTTVAKHELLFYSVLTLITVITVWSLYKDYKNLDKKEGM